MTSLCDISFKKNHCSKYPRPPTSLSLYSAQLHRPSAHFTLILTSPFGPAENLVFWNA